MLLKLLFRSYLVLFRNYSSETILQKLFWDLQELFCDLEKLFCDLQKLFRDLQKLCCDFQKLFRDLQRLIRDLQKANFGKYSSELLQCCSQFA